ncbi:MAG: PRC-barrel domain-containing protein [Hyphomicrobiaceae bacterium]
MASQSPYGALISSEQVEGTTVYSTANREQIGEINHLMIDRATGRVAYAVMSFGGFLGMGKDHYPVPWSALKYDTSLEGYVTGITEQQLQNAPVTGNASWADRNWESRVHQHYNAPYYW